MWLVVLQNPKSAEEEGRMSPNLGKKRKEYGYGSKGGSEQDPTSSFTPFDPTIMAGLFEKHRSETPQRSLCRAVLTQAIKNILKGMRSTKTNDRRIAAEEMLWVEDGSTENPFSFVNTCIGLDIDPNYLRQGVRILLARNNHLANPRSLPKSTHVTRS